MRLKKEDYVKQIDGWTVYPIVRETGTLHVIKKYFRVCLESL